MSRTFPRALFLLALCALLLSGAVQAAPGLSRSASPAAVQEAGLFAGLWSWIGARLESLPRFLASWGEEGCDIDPDGRCIDGSTGSGDEGCDIDPNGRCLDLMAPMGDAGCDMDPNGCPSSW